MNRAGRAGETLLRAISGVVAAGLLTIFALAMDAWAIVPVTLLGGAWLAGLSRLFPGVDENRFLMGMAFIALAGIAAGWVLPGAAPGLVLPLVGIAIAIAWRLARRRPSAALREIAAANRLTLSEPAWTLPISVWGEVDACRVEVAESDLGTAAVVSAPWLPADLTLEPPNLMGALDRVKTGDAAFDAEVHVSGFLDVALERLAPAARSAARLAAACGVELRSGTVRWRSRRAGKTPPLREMVALARALHERRSLVEAVTSDPEIGVRLRAVDELRELPSELRHSSLARALDDASPAVRLRAAEAILADDTSPDRGRAESIRSALRATSAGLSLASDDAGALSVAHEAGALSVVKKA